MRKKPRRNVGNTGGKACRVFPRLLIWGEKNKFLIAIREGFALLTPFILIYAVIHIFVNFPYSTYQTWLHSTGFPIFRALSVISSICINYFSVFVAITIGWCYARINNVSTQYQIILSVTCVLCFLILCGYPQENFNSKYLSTFGTFSCLLACMICCPLYIFLIRTFNRGGRKRCRSRINPSLGNSVRAVVPVALLILFFICFQTLIMHLTGGLCLQQTVSDLLLLHILQNGGNSLQTAFLFTLFVQLFWFLGIDGNNFFSTIDEGYFQSLFSANIASVQAGNHALVIANSCFINTLLVIGGSGSALALLLTILFRSKGKANKTMAKISLIPVLFNIGEVLNYGIPVIWNFSFFLPFLAAPLANLLIAYSATSAGFLPVAAKSVSTQMPIFLSGYFATGSISGAVLQGILLAVDCLIYYPFVRLNDRKDDYLFTQNVRKLELSLRQDEETTTRPYLMKMPGPLGTTANILADDLASDLAAGKLFLLYQPQFDSAGRFTGAEALLRWNHPVAGSIYPPLIIDLAQECGFLPDLENRIFRETCRSIKALKEYADQPFKVSVNITGNSPKYPGFEEMIDEAVLLSGIRPEDLWIEITEQDMLASTAEVVEKLYRLKAKGHKLLIDDFGMGHASITYLETNLFDVVKLDGSITRTVLKNSRSQEIVSSLVSLGKRLHLNVIAEYVDNPAQRDKLAELGCDIFQGYLYSKPVPLREMLPFTCGNTAFSREKPTNK